MNKQDPFYTLIPMLYDIYDSKEFVDGIYSYIDTEEKCLAMIDYIKSYEDVDPSSVCVMALEICDAYDK